MDSKPREVKVTSITDPKRIPYMTITMSALRYL
jgi:hypothetical protein